jgi:hypothetical protein
MSRDTDASRSDGKLAEAQKRIESSKLVEVDKGDGSPTAATGEESKSVISSIPIRPSVPLDAQIASIQGGGAPQAGLIPSFLGSKKTTQSTIITDPVVTSSPPPNSGPGHFAGQYRNGRIERYIKGQRQSAVPIQLGVWSVKLRTHSLNEGDEIIVEGKWRRGQFLSVYRIHNLTTGAIAFRGTSLIVYILLTLVLAAPLGGGLAVAFLRAGQFPAVGIFLGVFVAIMATVFIARLENKKNASFASNEK